MTTRAFSHLPLVAALGVVAGCGSSGPNTSDIVSELAPRRGGHLGPAVDSTATGPARFVQPLLEIYESNAAMAIARDLDAHYRAPASEGYEVGIDRILADLFGAGYGADTGFQLEVLRSGLSQPAWTPVAAEIRVVGTGRRGRRQTTAKAAIAGFSEPGDAQRVMIPFGAVSCEVAGSAVFALEDVVPGAILVTDQSVRKVEQDAAEKGAAAVVSSFQLPYCKDPTGWDRHYDAIFTGSVRPGCTLPSFYVSPRTAENMEVAKAAGSTFELSATVRTEVSELRTVVASIRGTERPEEVVYVVAHADGAGANDNAAGAGGIVELARSIKRLIATGRITRPSRTVTFIFGQESASGQIALERLSGTPIAAIVADMIGCDYATTGAVCLLERGWDPGAVTMLPPDSHTPWGAGDVVEEDVIPNGLSIVLREAMVDVGLAVTAESGVPWSTREHPWEGGSDHDAFLSNGIAAALVWHFTDFSYSTSLDRLDHVDADELRRTSVAIGAAALAVADARPDDLQRHLDSLNLERKLRLEAIRASTLESKAGLEMIWGEWFDGAASWLQAVTASEALPELPGLSSIDEDH